MMTLARQVAFAARQANAKLATIALDPEMDFYTQGLDSLDHVQILMKIEEMFGIQFADTDYDSCNSLDSIEAFLRRSGLAEDA